MGSKPVFFFFVLGENFCNRYCDNFEIIWLQIQWFLGERNSQNSRKNIYIYILARFLFMVQVGSQKHIRVFKFLFSYFVSSRTIFTSATWQKWEGKNKHTHTKRWASLFFLIRIWQFLPPPLPLPKRKISRIFNFKKIQKTKKKTLPICPPKKRKKTLVGCIGGVGGIWENRNKMDVQQH